jgi:hypothetical protein
MFTQTKIALAVATFIGMSGIGIAHATVDMKSNVRSVSLSQKKVSEDCAIQQKNDRRDIEICPIRLSRGENEPGDVRGEGKGHKVARGENEPGDVRGEGKGHKVARGENEPGDVRGEGKGHKIARGENEPGDVPGEGRGHKVFLVREANEPPRGQDNERPGDRQRGRGKLTDDIQLSRGEPEPIDNNTIGGSGKGRKIVA